MALPLAGLPRHAGDEPPAGCSLSPKRVGLPFAGKERSNATGVRMDWSPARVRGRPRGYTVLEKKLSRAIARYRARRAAVLSRR
jgi:hypothetical protein